MAYTVIEKIDEAWVQNETKDSLLTPPDKQYNVDGCLIICKDDIKISTMSCGCRIEIAALRATYCDCLLARSLNLKCSGCSKHWDSNIVENILELFLPREKLLAYKVTFRYIAVNAYFVECPGCVKYSSIDENSPTGSAKCEFCGLNICLTCNAEIDATSFLCSTSCTRLVRLFQNGGRLKIDGCDDVPSIRQCPFCGKVVHVDGSIKFISCGSCQPFCVVCLQLHGSDVSCELKLADYSNPIDDLAHGLAMALFERENRTVDDKTYKGLPGAVVWTRKKCSVVNGVDEKGQESDDEDEDDCDEHPLRAMLVCGCSISLQSWTSIVNDYVKSNKELYCPSCNKNCPWSAVEHALSFHLERSELLEVIIKHYDKILKKLTKCPICFSVLQRSSSAGNITCPACKKITCAVCEPEITAGTLCEICKGILVVLAASKTILLYGKEVANKRACPNCHQLIEYTSGCKRMFCSSCRCTFCYLCLHWISDSDDRHKSASCLCGRNCKVAPKQQSLEYNLKKDERCEQILGQQDQEDEFINLMEFYRILGQQDQEDEFLNLMEIYRAQLAQTQPSGTQPTQPHPSRTYSTQPQPSGSWCTIS